MDGRELHFKKWEIGFTVVATVIAIGGGILAYLDYRGRAEQEIWKSIYEKELEVCLEGTAAAAELLSATRDTFTDKVDAFALVKHGKALVISSKPVLTAMVAVYDESTPIYNDLIDEKIKDNQELECRRRPLAEAVLRLSAACRRSLEDRFKVLGNNEKYLDDVIMQWLGNCPPGCVCPPPKGPPAAGGGAAAK